jgi:hypothetical protein
MCLVLLCRHATDVDELHDDVLQRPASTVTVFEKSPEPKLSPLTVTDPMPVVGLFSSTFDITGASNENALPPPVPIIALTVVCTKPGYSTARGIIHWTAEAVVHVVVWQAAALRETVILYSPRPKLRPDTCTKMPPLNRPLAKMCEETGASNEKALIAVPATAPSVTIEYSSS